MQFYYNGNLLDLDGESTIALTFVANDLQKPESVQSSYSNTISIPATTKNKQALGYAHVLSSTGKLPYREGDVQVIAPDGRELFPFAKGSVEHYVNTGDGPRFEILLTAGNLDVFKVLGDKSIRDLDLSAYNHEWNINTIAATAINTTATTYHYTYPLLDRGKFLDLNNINIWDLWPATFGKLILDKIMQEAGFQYTGLDTELMKRLVIPSVKRFEYEDSTTKKYSMRAGLAATRDTERKTKEYTTVVQFASTTEPTYSAGELVQFNAGSSIFTAPQNMYVNVNVGVLVKLKMDRILSPLLAEIAGRVDIMHNGISLANTEIKTKNEITQVLNVSINKLYLKAGDTLYVRYKFRELGPFIKSYSEIYKRDSSFGRYADFFEVRMLPEFPKGGLIELNKWLPDIKQKDFLKFCLQLHAGMMQTDQYTSVVRINSFGEVEQNTAKARDWSSKYIPDTEDLSYKFGDFARKNRIIWKEDDTVKPGYGDGVITIDDETLELEKDIIEFPFAASQVGGSFALPALLNYEEKEGSDPVEYESGDIEPRVLLLGDDTLTFTLGQHVDSGDIENQVKYVVVGYSEVDYDNNTYKAGDIITGGVVKDFKVVKGHGYIYREDTFRTVTTRVLYFDGKPLSLNVQDYIIPTYYAGLVSILQQSKYLKLQLKLNPSDVQDFDFTRPVWIGQYQQFFYVNKISEFIPNQPTEVELARL